MQLVPLQFRHAQRVSEIHAEALAGDFLPSLGIRFLRVFYQAALESGAAFGFVQEQDGQAVGFILGSTDTSVLFRRVITNAAIRLAWAALPALFRRPSLLRKIAETFLYPQKESAAPEKAELVVIALELHCRGQGAGQALVQALEKVFRGQGVRSYKVTVLQENAGANRFYQRLGFQLKSQFALYGKRWNLYTRSIPEVGS